MAKELEVKVLNIDREEIESKLVSLGAELVKKELQINTIYDYPDGSFERERKGYIRIREMKDLVTGEAKSEFTLKKVVGSDKVKEYEEVETGIDDSGSLSLILNELGLVKKHQGSKERTRYRFENIVYDIDVWDEETLPYPYLEIEVESKDDIDRAVELIGFSCDDISLKTIKELRAEAGIEG